MEKQVELIICIYPDKRSIDFDIIDQKDSDKSMQFIPEVPNRC